MLKSSVFYILLLFPTLICWSQDSTLNENQDDVKIAKVLFAFDARRSFVLDNKVKFNGIKIGVELFEKHRMGLGFYALKQPVKFVGKINYQEYPDATDTLFFNFNYSGMFYDYVWLKTKRWELTTPTHFGLGGLEISYQDTSGVRSAPFIKRASYVIGFGGTVQFKVFRWFALGTGGGYRMMITQEENIKKPLNAPYYQFQIKVLIGELYRMAFKRDKLDDNW